jgi:hypothetical protein
VIGSNRWWQGADHDREKVEEKVGMFWLCQREAMMDGWLMCLRLKIVAMEVVGVRQ